MLDIPVTPRIEMKIAVVGPLLRSWDGDEAEEGSSWDGKGRGGWSGMTGCLRGAALGVDGWWMSSIEGCIVVAVCVLDMLRRLPASYEMKLLSIRRRSKLICDTLKAKVPPSHRRTKCSLLQDLSTSLGED